MATTAQNRRYQARVSIDERMGELWAHLQSVPERSRVAELIFLAQLGLVTRSGLAARVSDAQKGKVLEAQASDVLTGKLAPVSSSRLADARVLSAWASAESAFPDET